MFISVTNEDGTRTFAAELAEIFMETDRVHYSGTPLLRIYGKHEDGYCIAKFKSGTACKAAMD